MSREFQKYLRMGGFPAVHTADYSLESIYKLVYDIYSSVILRDTVQRHGIRNVELLERVVRFVFDNIGNRLMPSISPTISKASNGGWTSTPCIVI